MRINKYLSHNTGYSRREADELIKTGKVSINGKVLKEMGYEVKEGDKVRIGTRFIKEKTEFTAIVYNKPKGELVTKKDDRGRKTIYDNLPRGLSKFVSVGRLDFASEGLLILTDAPGVADALMKGDFEREYYIKVRGEITEQVKEAMREGFFAKDATKGAHAKTKIKSMEFAPFLGFHIFEPSGGYTRARVIIKEGQNRELRRFFGYFDLEVVDLKRVSFGMLSLDNLGEGKWRYFSQKEYEELRAYLKESGIRY